MEKEIKQKTLKKAINTNPMANKKTMVSEAPIMAQERLSNIINNTPVTITIAGVEHPVNALKMGVQWLIAEEAVKIVKVENANMGDVLKHFAVNIPSVVHVLTMSVINDKDGIFLDFKKRIYSDEYNALYDTIMWESDSSTWMTSIVEIMNLIDVEVFFYITDAIQIVRGTVLTKKIKMEEAKLSHLERNMDK